MAGAHRGQNWPLSDQTRRRKIVAGVVVSASLLLAASCASGPGSGPAAVTGTAGDPSIWPGSAPGEPLWIERAGQLQDASNRLSSDRQALLTWWDDALAAQATLTKRQMQESQLSQSCSGQATGATAAGLAPLGSDMRDRVGAWNSVPASLKDTVQSIAPLFVATADDLDGVQTAVTAGDCGSAAGTLDQARAALAQTRQALLLAGQAANAPIPPSL